MQAYRDYYALGATVLRANRRSNPITLLPVPAMYATFVLHLKWVNWQKITAHDHETGEIAPVPVPARRDGKRQLRSGHGMYCGSSGIAKEGWDDELPTADGVGEGAKQ
jgi:hypothetical protein